jgi:hypothetical protein
MTDDIVASISEFSSPEFVVKLAAASGLNRSAAAEVVSAAVPMILSSLAQLVAKPGGSRMLTNAIAEQSRDRGSFPSNLFAPAHYAAAGNNVLSSLLGPASPMLLVYSLSGVLGVSSNAVRTILGLITPRVLDGLWRLQRARGLDADGLAWWLVEQKGHIADAIPPDLQSNHRDGGIVDISHRHRFCAPSEVVRPESQPATQIRHQSDAKRRVPLPFWVLAIAALSALLWTFDPGQEHGEREAAAVFARPYLLPPSSGEVLYFARADAQWRSIGASRNSYVNQVIYNARGEQLGSVQDLMVGPDGKVVAAVISVGRYLGFGDKLVAVPFSALRLEKRDGDSNVVIDLAKEALLSAPQYEEAAKPKR